MIYISKEQDTVVVTDSVTDYMPQTLDVYLDEVFIGTFNNLSDTVNYIVFKLPPIDLQEKEYIMRIIVSGMLLKAELVVIRGYNQLKVKEVNNTKKIIMYEPNINN